MGSEGAKVATDVEVNEEDVRLEVTELEKSLQNWVFFVHLNEYCTAKVKILCDMRFRAKVLAVYELQLLSALEE